LKSKRKGESTPTEQRELTKAKLKNKFINILVDTEDVWGKYFRRKQYAI
jgi:predicted metalloprotease